MKDLKLIQYYFFIPDFRKIVCFTFSPTKTIDTSRSIFPVKLGSCIAYGSASSVCCLIKSIAIILECFLK